MAQFNMCCICLFLTQYHHTVGSNDITVDSSEVVFDSSSGMMECITLTASADSAFEPAENFTFELMSVNSPPVMIDSTRRTARFTILDLDGELTRAKKYFLNRCSELLAIDSLHAWWSGKFVVTIFSCPVLHRLANNNCLENEFKNSHAHALCG